jgi:hypothetical protein
VAGKGDLNEITTSNVRMSDTTPAEQTAADIVAEIRASRPGQNV